MDVEGPQVMVIYDPTKTSPRQIVNAIISSGVDSVSTIEPPDAAS